MRRLISVNPLLFIALASCGPHETKSNNNLERAEIVRDQIGRYASLSTTEDFPPMILDTATGCVIVLNRLEDGKVEISEAPIADSGRTCMDLRNIEVVYNGTEMK